MVAGYGDVKEDGAIQNDCVSAISSTRRSREGGNLELGKELSHH